MTKCKQCFVEKSDDEYYFNNKTQKHGSKCKECIKKNVRKNYRENISHYQEYERSRAMAPHRVEERDRYQKSEQGKKVIYRLTKRYRENNKIKQQAHNRVNHAVIAGHIKSPDLCESCGSSQRLNAHHDDYTKQLDVRWLCARCHRDWHLKNGEADGSNRPPLTRKEYATYKMGNNR